MNARDARLILQSHRADGRYPPDDPLFAEALAAAARDPELAAWLAREHALDATVSGHLDRVAPPSGLREAILVGGRASRLARPWWRRPAWMSAAACFAFVAALAGYWLRPGPAEASPANLAEFGVGLLVADRHPSHAAEGAAALSEMLATCPEPLCRGLTIDTAEFARRGCAQLTFQGRHVYEVCFQRNGRWYHLFVTACETTDPDVRDEAPVFVELGGYSAATWSNGETRFAIAALGDIDVIRSVL